MKWLYLSAMLGAMLFSAVTAEVVSASTGLSSAFCGVPLFILLVIGDIRFLRGRCYRPPENHVGVLYRFGRFYRFVAPDEWIFLWPWIDYIRSEVSLYMRPAELTLKDVELRDGLIVNARFKIFFKTDPRLAADENLLQVLRFQGVEWAEMVKTSTEDIVRNQVFLNLTYDEMTDLRKSREIKKAISGEVSERMKNFGIILNERHGVMPVAIQPNHKYRDAVQTSKAATPMGLASYERLRPVLDLMREFRPDKAQAALLLEIASKIVETGELPEIVLSPLSDLPVNPMFGVGGHNGGNGGGQNKRKSISQYSSADD